MEDEDKSSKTEEPTERKLRKAREEGNVPKSKEVNNLFMLLGAIIVVAAAMPPLMQQTLNTYGSMFSEAGTWRVSDLTQAGSVMQFLMQRHLVLFIPIAVLLLFFALFGGMIQTGFIFTTKPIEPKMNKISLVKGFERMFSLKSLMEFLKTLLKIVIIGAAVYAVMYFQRDDFMLLIDMTPMDIVRFTQKLILQMLAAALAIMVIFASIDFMYQRFEFMKEQRMSMKEIKDEFKETEGDPHVKGRQRQIRQERARARMMQEVPKSDVVITNPTHYSIALMYKPDEGQAAPKVVAKGVDHMAMRIREVAQENGIPLHEDPPLARQLYKDVDIEEEIPVDLYETVAQVIAFVMGQKNKKK